MIFSDTSIDIYEEVDRWYINYIVYHKERLIKRGEVDKSNALFADKTLQNIQQVEAMTEQNQIEAIQTIMRQQAQSSTGALRIIDKLQNGTIITDAFDQIADAINAEIDNASNKVDFDNYDQIVREAKDFSNLFSSTPEVQRINEFFNLVLKALNIAEASNPDILNALSDIGKLLIGTDFAFDQTQTNIAQTATSYDIQVAQDVLRYLNNAMEKLKTTGTIDSKSFATTIQHIFTNTIGKKIGAAIYANAIQNANEQIEDIVDDMVKGSNGKLKRGTSRNKQYTNTINVKIFGQDALSLKIRGSSHTDFNIEIANTSDIQWYTKKKKKIPISGFKHSVSLQDYFAPGQEAYYAYNMIAHRYSGPDFEESVNVIRSSVAASFVNQWIQGNISKYSSPLKKNLQFIVINKKIYPIGRIIRNICSSFADITGGSNSSLIDIKGSVKNKWIGGKYPNIENALSRSAMVNEVMNTFTIAMNLNSNILTQYAY